MTPLRQRMLEELQRRNYSQATIESYIPAVKEFAEYCGKSPASLGAEDVRRYQLYLINEKKLMPHTVKVRISALRFLYWKTLKRRDLYFDDLPIPKAPMKLPVVLSLEEVTPTDRSGFELTAPHHSDRPLCNRHTPSRANKVEGKRHRQQAHGHSYPRGQGSARP